MKLMITTALVATLAAGLFAETPLTSLQPTAVEFGTLDYPDEGLRIHVQPHGAGPGKFDTGAFYSGNQHWPGATKIVKSVPWDEPTVTNKYSSRETDRFMVQGESITGVGLWVQVTMMYHWLEYRIPQGASTFTGLAYTTDDAHGYMNRHYVGYQDFDLLAEVDGKNVYSNHFNRIAGDNPGELIGELNISLPAGSSTIRFKLQASSHIDWNKNSEVVITEGMFK